MWMVNLFFVTQIDSKNANISSIIDESSVFWLELDKNDYECSSMGSINLFILVCNWKKCGNTMVFLSILPFSIRI